jgi:N-methylhydantoinase B
MVGGNAGGTVDSSLITSTGEKTSLPSKTTRSVEPGTRITLRTAGGGGYGSPHLRNPELVRSDVVNGYISIERAKTDYAVSLDPVRLEVNIKETEMLRKSHDPEQKNS